MSNVYGVFEDLKSILNEKDNRVSQLEQEVKELKELQEKYVWITREELKQYSDINQALMGQSLAQHDKGVTISALEKVLDDDSIHKWAESGSGDYVMSVSDLQGYIEQLQQGEE